MIKVFMRVSYRLEEKEIVFSTIKGAYCFGRQETVVRKLNIVELLREISRVKASLA